MNRLVQLPPAGFPLVRPLIPDGVGHVTFSHGVLEGTMSGQVWVDDPAAPTTAVVMSDADFSLAFGSPAPDLVRAALPAMLAANQAEKPGIIATTDAWTEALAFLGAPASRNEFHFEGLPAEASSRTLPLGYRAVPLDSHLAATFGPAGVDPWVVEVWGGPEQFAERAYGWAILDPDGALASFCTCCALGGGEAEVEIGTSMLHREKGLASIAGARFIESSLARGYTPAWTCAAGNVGSNRLATLLGFRYTRTVRGYPLR